ncbi:MAG TPA: PAS domain S-box protein [Sediminibacterium sp.]|nr:PAS domain S-box protein [Sediminibacterium sp.]
MPTVTNHFFVKSSRKVFWLVVFAIISFLLFAGLLYNQGRKQGISRYWVERSNKAIANIDSIGLAFLEAQTVTRNYLLTGESEWKKKLQNIHQRIRRQMDTLQAYIADNQVENSLVQQLAVLSDKKKQFQLDIISELIPVQEKMKKLRSNGEADQQNRELQLSLERVRHQESLELKQRIQQNQASYSTIITLICISGGFSIILVLVILYQLNQDVRLRKDAEARLADREKLYRNLIENAGVIMYTTDKAGHINFVNNRVTEITGYRVEELVGKHFSILLETEKIQEIIQFYADQFVRAIPTTVLEFPIRPKGGGVKWVEQSAQLITEDGKHAGFQCMVKDITERKLMEAELGKSEKSRKENEYRLHAIMENSTALIFLKDLQGRYVMANRKFKTFFGISDELLIGQTDYDFNPPELADHYKQMDEQVFRTRQPMESEEKIETIWGTKHLLLLKFPLLTQDHELLGVSGIATDITDKVELQRQHLASLQKAEKAQQIQEQFLANMSHEIRTPMNGIQGMTRLLLETALTEEQRKYTDIISRSLSNLVAIVNNVLDYSNLTAGKLVLDSFVFRIRDVLQEIARNCENQLLNRPVAFKMEIDAAVPDLVKGDAYRLKQVLTNLTGNAIKFTEKGEISLFVSLEGKKEEKAILQFRLEDTGIGIPENKLETIFESFAQAGKNISSDYGGAGLGLSISRGLIELQGGRIWATNNPGNGAAFIFRIPFSLADLAETPASTEDYSERLKGIRILVVEDNPVNQMLVRIVLKKIQVNIEVASNGMEAIECCRKQAFDLIIMDLQMPEMDGYETTRYLRQEMKLKTPIIAMTATALKEDQEKSAAVGMNDFMIKPFDFNDLYERLIRLLFSGQKETRQELNPQRQETLFDLSDLLELDDTEALQEIVGMFLSTAPADIIALSQYTKEEQRDTLSRAAHKLKSALATIQARPMIAMMRKIELGAKEGVAMAELQQWVQEAIAALPELENGLRDAVKQTGHDSTG